MYYRSNTLRFIYLPFVAPEKCGLRNAHWACTRALGTQCVVARAEGDDRSAASAPFADNRVERLDQRIIGEGNRSFFSSNMNIAQNPYRRSADEKKRTWYDLYPDAVFLDEIVFFSGKLFRKHRDFLLAVLNEGIG